MNQAQIDVQQLRIKHILFKSKVRSVLYGGTFDADFFSASGPVNTWFLHIGQTRYGHLPQMQSLLQLHKDLNSSATGLFNLYKAGNIEQAHEGLKDIEKKSEQFLALLTSLEQHVT